MVAFFNRVADLYKADSKDALASDSLPDVVAVILGQANSIEKRKVVEAAEACSSSRCFSVSVI